MKEKFHILDNIKTISLSNIENYQQHISASFDEIIDKYLKIVSEYMILLSENIYITNLVYFKFILIRGLETINNIFRLILLYTKNINLANYHSQKAFYMYIEFIEQISDVQNSFLQLSSRDAVLFVYKKTIFEINHEFRKKIKEENIKEQIFEKLDKYLIVIKNILCFYLQNAECSYENKNMFITTCCNSLKTYNKIISTRHNTLEIIECITLLLDKVNVTSDLIQYKNILVLSEWLECVINKIIKNILSDSYENTIKKINKIKQTEELEYILVSL
jgi:hypothetical protein